jgi:hypothetical protein
MKSCHEKRKSNLIQRLVAHLLSRCSNWLCVVCDHQNDRSRRILKPFRTFIIGLFFLLIGVRLGFGFVCFGEGSQSFCLFVVLCEIVNLFPSMPPIPFLFCERC